MAYNHERSMSTRIQKNIARTAAVTNYGLLAAKVAKFITVPGIPDIKEALKLGRITLNTFIIAINHGRKDRNAPYNHKVIAQIERDLTEIGFKYVVIGEFFESNRGISMIGDVVKQHGKIDYAFIDLCGLATPSFCSALHKMQHLFSEKATIAITMCTSVRQPKLIDQWCDAFFEKLYPLTMQIMSTPTSCEWAGKALLSKRSPGQEVLRKQLCNFLWQYQAVLASFDMYTTEVVAALHYRDFTRMGLVVFDITQKEGGNNMFHYIEEICENAKQPGANGDRSLSRGERAKATRRENAMLAV